MPIKSCTCQHAWQDKIYGQGKRVQNPKKAGGYRCTVCGKDSTESSPKKSK